MKKPPLFTRDKDGEIRMTILDLCKCIFYADKDGNVTVYSKEAYDKLIKESDVQTQV